MGAVVSRIREYRNERRARKLRISAPIYISPNPSFRESREPNYPKSPYVSSSVSHLRVIPQLEALNEECPICLCEVEEEEPIMQCRHRVHQECLKAQLMHGVQKFEEEHMNFKCSTCPLCNLDIQHPTLQFIVNPILELKKQSLEIGMEKMMTEMAEEVIKNVENPRETFNAMSRSDKEELILRKLLFFQCSDCNRAFFGGTRSCMDDFAAVAADANDNKNDDDNNNIIVNVNENVNVVVDVKVDGGEEIEIEAERLNEIEKLVVIQPNNNEMVDSLQKEEENQNLFSEFDSSYDFTYDNDCDDCDDCDDLILNIEEQQLNEEVKKEEQQQQQQHNLDNDDDDEISEEYIEIGHIKQSHKVDNNHINNIDNNNIEIKEEKKKFQCMACMKKMIKGACEHSTDDLIFKCMKCCSIATYYCLGTEFYCDRCHSDLRTVFPCPGVKKCPLGMDHPPNTVGTHGGGKPQRPFAIACKICGPIERSFEVPDFRVNYG